MKWKRKIKRIQENNPKLFSWVLGGTAGWLISIILAAMYLLRIF